MPLQASDAVRGVQKRFVLKEIGTAVARLVVGKDATKGSTITLDVVDGALAYHHTREDAEMSVAEQSE